MSKIKRKRKKRREEERRKGKEGRGKQGVREIIPLTNSKAHRIPNDNNGRHPIGAHLLITIDEVIHAKRDAARVRKGEHAHGPDEPEPVHAVGGADAPDDEGDGDDDGGEGEEVEAVLGLHDAFVVAGDAAGEVGG